MLGFCHLKWRFAMSRLFVGNLPHAASETDLQQWVEANGFVVESVQIILDRLTGASRGFGFVTIKEEGTIEMAITALNGKKMRGRILTVNQAFPVSQSLQNSPAVHKNSA
jgi:RNA recognition motif-containing protein